MKKSTNNQGQRFSSLKKLLSCLFILLNLMFFSCSKEYSCEGCRETNKPPVAKAGPDTFIVLPVDSIKLDGSGSVDPDGTISSFQWKKIEGPVTFSIKSASSEKTVVNNLTAGTYQFELSVTDAGGLIAKDTVAVSVNPLANDSAASNAVADIIITLPLDSLYVWGTFEAWWSPTGYEWSQISGPSVVPTNPGVLLFARHLIPGFYSFRVESNTRGIDTINVSVIDNRQDPNTITFRNLKWLLADEYGIGVTDLSLRFPPQPSLFIMPGYELRPLEVFLQINGSTTWLHVPVVQTGTSYVYDSSSNGIWVMRLPVDDTWVGKTSSIKVKLL